jgi:hypothetical protein
VYTSIVKGKRVWLESTIGLYEGVDERSRFDLISKGLLEANCVLENELEDPLPPVIRMNTYKIGGKLVFFLYLVEIQGSFKCCFKVGKGDIKVQGVYRLEADTIFKDIREEWKSSFS